MSVKAVFTPAPAPEGVVTITLAESEARQFAGGYVPASCRRPASAEAGEREYTEVRDKLRYAINDALRSRDWQGFTYTIS